MRVGVLLVGQGTESGGLDTCLEMASFCFGSVRRPAAPSLPCREGLPSSLRALTPSDPSLLQGSGPLAFLESPLCCRVCWLVADPLCEYGKNAMELGVGHARAVDIAWFQRLNASDAEKVL